MTCSVRTLAGLAALLLAAPGLTASRAEAEAVPFMVVSQGYSSAVNAVALASDGRRALSAGHDNLLRLWDLPTGLLLKTFDAQTESINAAAFSPDGGKVLSAGDDGRLRLWDAATGQPAMVLEGGHAGEALAAAFSPDGRQALSGGRDGGVRLWDLATGLPLAPFAGHAGAVRSVAFTPDGRQALSGGGDKAVKVWDVATGGLTRSLDGHSDEVTAVAVSPDGRRALSGSRDGTLRLWDLATGRMVLTFGGGSGEILSVALSADGRLALSGGKDKTPRLWDATSGRLVRTFPGHSDIVTAATFSPDGRQALSGGWDKTLRVWSADAGALMSTIDLQAAAFSPNGHFSIFTGLPLPGTPDLSRLGERLKEKGFRRGDPVFLRIFKGDREAELWMSRRGRFELFAVYPICAWSGQLGPKLQERDYQAPEGFYAIAKDQLHPNSHYHRAFNLGYPNLLDRTLHRTGAHLMMHGGCRSAGCYAMTDPVIDELWTLVTAALDGGQERAPVHVFPFRMTEARLAAFAWHPWAGFWRDMKPAYDLFEASHIPPLISVCNGRYGVRRGSAAAIGAPPLQDSCPAAAGGLGARASWGNSQSTDRP